MKKAFTLIELLVVVLIIGILAAIALPQYQKAVEKSRGAEAIVILKALTDAQERYYLANNAYTAELSDLDIGAPSETHSFQYSCNTQSCYAYPKSGYNYFFWFVMQNKIHSGLANNSVGKHWCYGNSEKGKKICSAFGKQDTVGDKYYTIN